MIGEVDLIQPKIIQRMSSGALVSIIICTCNRSAALRNTLESLGKVRVPSEWKVEVIVVDNASTDDTASSVQSFTLGNATLQYLFEPKTGQSNARNAGLAHARGEFILFTDDDVLHSEDWLEQMLSPLLHDGCDAVTGQITLASHLMRPWMTPMHKWFLASSHDAQPHNGSCELIGASMGFRRSVLKRVSAFDPELGPGTLGFGDDTLFGWQLTEAGFRIDYAPKARADHHLDSSRLRRAQWLDAARKRGRTEAYLRYHWEHADIRSPYTKWLWYWLKLRVRSILQSRPPLQGEGCPNWEMSYVLHMEKNRQFCLERRRPRNYSRRGLIKHNL